MEKFSAEELELPVCQYEYLDHTADVQIHSWGSNIKEAFEQAAVAMYGYMTNLDNVEISETREVEVDEDDLQNALFHFLDECLFVFCDDPYFIGCKVVITEFTKGDRIKIKAKIYGELFCLHKHEQGTEVKAITYSNMEVFDREDEECELFVIIDI